MTGLRWAKRSLQLGQRYRRKRDGAVLVIANVHRKDGTVEAFWAAALDDIAWPKRFQVRFGELRDDYELLARPWEERA